MIGIGSCESPYAFQRSLSHGALTLRKSRSPPCHSENTFIGVEQRAKVMESRTAGAIRAAGEQNEPKGGVK